jgi:hypothetical protein
VKRELLIGGAVVAGGGLAYLLFRERKMLQESVQVQVETARETAKEVVKVVDKAAKKTAARIAKMAISNDVLKNFERHGIPQILENHRGSIPWALAAATAELESGGDPYIYNYYTTDPKSGKKVKGVGHWVPGTALPTNSWANGLFQILRRYMRPVTAKGYDIDFADAFDADKNATAALKVLQTQWNRAKQAPTDSLRWALFYVGQNRGGGTDEKPGLIQALKNINAGKLAQIIAAAGIPSAVGGVAGIVASRVPLWQAYEREWRDSLSVKTGADAGNGELTDEDQLLVAAQNAEMARDLDEAADLREQLDVLDDEEDIA